MADYPIMITQADNHVRVFVRECDLCALASPVHNASTKSRSSPAATTTWAQFSTSDFSLPATHQHHHPRCATIIYPAHRGGPRSTCDNAAPLARNGAPAAHVDVTTHVARRCYQPERVRCRMHRGRARSLVGPKYHKCLRVPLVQRVVVVASNPSGAFAAAKADRELVRAAIRRELITEDLRALRSILEEDKEDEVRSKGEWDKNVDVEKTNGRWGDSVPGNGDQMRRTMNSRGTRMDSCSPHAVLSLIGYRDDPELSLVSLQIEIILSILWFPLPSCDSFFLCKENIFVHDNTNIPIECY
ncbi:hypothetical protein BC938DRAFT_481183 [Jimgerdemannia flammicorona]|uniref:Uncharacterized protein n=1 Tax=Jimgerdemannia flammicorona TaxID=994334 RepID=A0A433QGP4_9FUNG|nr:hypothetical protein BC938DRAFT_481183 [Jimgerdemannia flammicorona]